MEGCPRRHCTSIHRGYYSLYSLMNANENTWIRPFSFLPNFACLNIRLFIIIIIQRMWWFHAKHVNTTALPLSWCVATAIYWHCIDLLYLSLSFWSPQPPSLYVSLFSYCISQLKIVRSSRDRFLSVLLKRLDIQWCGQPGPYYQAFLCSYQFISQDGTVVIVDGYG